jgi:hypothetical protein
MGLILSINNWRTKLKNKKEIRAHFRQVCLDRDKDTCRMCGRRAISREDALEVFDIHHIVDRSLLPAGGYVLENGITLCRDSCHLRAEQYHSTGTAYPGFAPEDLYAIINSSSEKAIEASQKLEKVANKSA